jgi:hypothetical protein
VLKRIFNLVVLAITFGIVNIEKRSVRARRVALLDQRRQAVGKAREMVLKLGGAVRTNQGAVARLEDEVAKLKARKEGLLANLKKATPGEPRNERTKAMARQTHSQLVSAEEELFRARASREALDAQYAQAKEMILTAERDLVNAEREGEALDRRLETAERTKDLVEATTSLRGLGAGDELAAVNREIAAKVADAEGASMAAIDMANAESEMRDVDSALARQETDAAFEEELAALEEANPLGLPKGEKAELPPIERKMGSKEAEVA